MCKTSIKIFAFKGFLSFMNRFNVFYLLFSAKPATQMLQLKGLFPSQTVSMSFFNLLIFFKASITIEMLLYFMNRCNVSHSNQTFD